MTQNIMILINRWQQAFFVYKRNYIALMKQMQAQFFPTTRESIIFLLFLINFIGFEIDFDSIYDSFETLNEFYLILNYHTDDDPIGMVLPPIGQTAKMPKVSFPCKKFALLEIFTLAY